MTWTITKKVISMLALSLALVTAVVAGPAQQSAPQDAPQNRRGAERGGRRQGPDVGRYGGLEDFARRFNLSDEQRAQMRSIVNEFLESTRTLREQLRTQRQKEFDPFRGDTFNELTVRAAAQSRANTEVELAVARARMMSRLYTILTPEQKAQVSAERRQREQRRQEERQQRRGGTIAPPNR